jgi:hydrogenase small subunit
METFCEVMCCMSFSRRRFMKYCSLTAPSLGLALSFMLQIAHAMEDKPCLPVQGLHGLVCTCCTEPFIPSAHPLTKDVILSMIRWDCNNPLMAAAGHPAGL